LLNFAYFNGFAGALPQPSCGVLMSKHEFHLVADGDGLALSADGTSPSGNGRCRGTFDL
jgi:hypothetical protein